MDLHIGIPLAAVSLPQTNKMTCEYVFKDATDIYLRLFNHRAAIQGLASNFVKEFEERRGESDHISITRTLEMVTDCRDHAYPEATQGLKDHLDELRNTVKTTTQMCSRIIQDSEEKKSGWLEGERERRREEWKEFMKVQESRKSRVEEEFRNTVRNVESQYSQLEDKLKSGTNKAL